VNINVPFKTTSKQDEIFICCPACFSRRGKADEDFKMGINLSKKLFHCFKCNANRFNTNLQAILTNLDFFNEVSEDLSSMISMLQPKQKKELNFVNLELISDPVDPNETPIAFDYLTMERQLSMTEIENLGVRVGKSFWDKNDQGQEFENKRWSGRILFPFWEQGVCRFVVGRTYTGREPKYLNSTHGKGTYVYGIDRVQDRTAILCEGIISGIAAERYTGVAGISILGYYATFLQLVKIRNKVDTLYMCIDGGVSKAIERKLENELRECNFKRIYKVSLPGKSDPDDLKEKFTEYFNKAEIISWF